MKFRISYLQILNSKFVFQTWNLKLWILKLFRFEDCSILQKFPIVLNVSFETYQKTERYTSWLCFKRCYNEIFTKIQVPIIVQIIVSFVTKNCIFFNSLRYEHISYETIFLIIFAHLNETWLSKHNIWWILS